MPPTSTAPRRCGKLTVSLSPNRYDFDTRREPLFGRTDAVFGRGRPGRRGVNLAHGFHTGCDATEDDKALTIGISPASEFHLRLVSYADRETDVAESGVFRGIEWDPSRCCNPVSLVRSSIIGPMILHEMRGPTREPQNKP